MRFTKTLSSFCLTLSLSCGATAQTAPTLADDGLQPVIDHLTQSLAENSFERGMLLTLRAVEKSLQTRYTYGIGDRLSGVPLLRIQTGQSNPSPEAATPETLSTLVASFLDDIDTARTTLESAAPNAFTLTLQDLWFDVNSNGTRDRGEGVMEALGPIVLGWQYTQFAGSEAAQQPLTIRFDAADQAWLVAYTHMLSGFGNLYMAFDPAPVFADLAQQKANLANVPTIPNYYDQEALAAEIAELEAAQAATQDEITRLQNEVTPLRQRQREVYRLIGSAETDADRTALEEELAALQDQLLPLDAQLIRLRTTQRFESNEIDAARAKLSQQPSALQSNAEQLRDALDMVYVLLAAIQQEPDAANITAAYEHWRNMITENRRFWALLAEETDNDREWIPNPQQVSALPVDVPEETALAWQDILTDAEAVLEGRLLVPHPLLPPGHGIHIPSYVDNPAPLGLLEWVHGIGAYPFVAKGPMITGQNWQAFGRLTGGNAGGFALFFN